MLPHTYRFQAHNRTGQTVTSIDVFVRRKKLDDTGAVAYESAEAQPLNGVTPANDAVSSSSAILNATDEWLEGDGYIEVVGHASGDGYVDLYLQAATDGGTVWPSDKRGKLVCTVAVGNSETVRENFEF